jgi:hypothetical protein
MLVDKGKYVRIRKHVILPGKRDQSVPAETQKVPLKMWVRGRLLEESELFEETSILTATGRIVRGELKEVEPRYKHDFGDFVEELACVREVILKEMWGADDDL